RRRGRSRQNLRCADGQRRRSPQALHPDAREDRAEPGYLVASLAGQSAMKIALDAMGGDFAPEQIVAGGVQAHRELGLDVIFVGVKDRVDAALATSGAGKWAQIEEAPEVIAMDEHPAQAVRSKKASSIVRGIQMVEDGRVGGFVSAGNSGAVMAGALFGLRRIAGIDRPAIGSIIPMAGGGDCFLLGVGAHADAKPKHLLQYAVMGSIYAQTLVGIPTTHVAPRTTGRAPQPPEGAGRSAPGRLAGVRRRASPGGERRGGERPWPVRRKSHLQRDPGGA